MFIEGKKLHFYLFSSPNSAQNMIKNKKPSAPKTLPFKHTEDDREHNYATAVEISSSNKRDRGDATPTRTPEKAHMEKKTKGTPSEEATNTSTETILNAVASLGKRVDDRMEEISSQMQQHSTMLAAISGEL